MCRHMCARSALRQHSSASYMPLVHRLFPTLSLQIYYLLFWELTSASALVYAFLLGAVPRNVLCRRRYIILPLVKNRGVQRVGTVLGCLRGAPYRRAKSNAH
ncbi:hypothetical protein EVAR_21197_1 [Eumeta japonica]|uniref:Uncharacterized protein n=1 Tax=Eumeta variegata TaxID=151549 RepID=A0A4C1UPU6_EUMVA|nr:hypothetical protein EVAR_21197_1 [Eumeta japonica]